MYHKCKYTKNEIIQTNNLQKFEKIQRNILKPACVVAVGVGDYTDWNNPLNSR
jgi:hypothetical protein